MRITLNNNSISQTTSVKYLGVIFDNKLNWQFQIDNVNKKLSKACYAITKLRKIVNLNILIQVYYALAYSCLIYCVTSWGSATSNYLNKIKIKQKKIVRIMTFSRFNSHSNPLFHKLNLLKFEDIFKFRVAMLTNTLLKIILTNLIQIFYN